VKSDVDSKITITINGEKYTGMVHTHTVIKNYFALQLQLFKKNTENYPSGLVWFTVFNATFNNISVISCLSVLLVEETRLHVPGENY
jgi:hypothetical protein